MAQSDDHDEHDDGPSLQMPSLSLRRRRRASEPTEPSEPADSLDPAEPVAGPTEPDASTGGDPATVAAPEKVAAPPLRARVRRPSLGGLPAAALSGLGVGVLAVLLTWLAGAGCNVVRGTSSCGGAIGLPLLLGGLVLLAWAGSLALRALGVTDAGSTSLLAVGILAVLVMVFLLGSLDQWWSAVAAPLLAAGCYAGSWWVTTSVVGDDG
ncbi:hypothetical protein ASG76_07060 [Nocardioides sp. Soil774]|uniref:hypothetical protein n=1 Tax=Nocardioides sp. Soil774 TaxID=1736408 RepID=UPI0006FD5597|nr:hypothetical protein [Nocardioides sp. Soil774]KRE95403.1 hypothetical protein ASG76_07060 [Nocardioides sp. Soil774]